MPEAENPQTQFEAPSEMRPKISIVLPVYNERTNLEPLLEAIRSTHRSELADRCDLEVLFVDDGSTDGSTDILKELAKRYNEVRAVLLARNFGHQAAISAGYEHASGSAIVAMDSDLQHPVEKIPDLVARWEDGYDVVYAVRDADHGGFLKRWCSRGFYAIFNALSSTKILPGSADYRLITSQVRDALAQLPERCRFLRGLIPWLGFRSTSVSYTPKRRRSGKPKYRLWHSVGLSIMAFTGFSIAPLRAFVLMGAIFLLISLGYLVYCVVDWLAGGSIVRGWPSIVALVVLTQGLMLIAFGIQAEYLAKIMLEVKRRPEYIVERVIDGTEKNGERTRVLRKTPGLTKTPNGSANSTGSPASSPD